MFGKVDFREDGKKNERKRVEKTFLRVFGWEGERGKWWWGSGVFSPGSPKSFLSKMERKLSGRSLIGKWQRCPCALAHRLVQYVFFFSWSGRCLYLLFLFLKFFLFIFSWTLPLLFLLLYLFIFISWAGQYVALLLLPSFFFSFFV